MKFLQQMIFYCLLAGTGYLALYYIYVAVFNTSEINPYFIKQVFGIASFLVLAMLYKAYHVGEINSEYLAGIKWVMLSWVPYILVTVGYIIIAKLQGLF